MEGNGDIPARDLAGWKRLPLIYQHDCAQYACGNTGRFATNWHPDCRSPSQACGFYLGWGGIEYCSKHDNDHPCIFYAFGDWTGYYGPEIGRAHV